MVFNGLLTLMILSGFTLAGSSMALAQEDFLDKREKMMKGFSAASKAIKAGVSDKDYKTVAAKARDIAGSLEATSFAKHWPQNSTDPESRARPEIWQKWDDFMAQAYDGRQKALALAAAADSKNEAKVAATYKAFGALCGNCHKPYRAEKKK